MTEPDLVVRVIPDVTGIDKVFDYLVEAPDADRVTVGTEVRIRLAGRAVRGWVVAVGVTPPAGLTLQRVLAVRGVGPSSEIVDLAAWAAHRWAGHPVHLLRTASPPTIVGVLPPPAPRPVAVTVPGVPGEGLVDDALAGGPCVVRMAPGIDRFGFIVTALSRARVAHWERSGGQPPSAIVVCPNVDSARRLAGRLRRTGLPVALVADDRPGSALSEQWARAASGGAVVVGARSAAWASAPSLCVSILVDEHDESLQGEQTPTWHARDVLLERCARLHVPLVMLSPCPTLEALDSGRLLTSSRRDERGGWPPVELIDRRQEDPTTASSILSSRLADVLRVDGRAICVLNRTGRARLLTCRACDELVRCEACGTAVHTDDEGWLVCRRCGERRPPICANCGGTALKTIRTGVARVREELEALLGEPVVEVAGTDRGPRAAASADLEHTRVLVGTEAVLHRVGTAAVVVFLDFDQELAAPRYRASEQAMALLVRAARMLGPRSRSHRLVVQTRLPDHPVLQAALHADPSRLTIDERPLREALRFPPTAALALVSGQAAPGFVEALRGSRLEVLGGGEGPWLVRAQDHSELSDVLGGTHRPQGRLRIEVDPLRV